MNPTIIPITPGRHAAQMGLILGAYMSLTSVLFMYIPSVPLLGLAFVLAFVCTPILSYRLGLRYRALFPSEAPYPFVLAWSHSTQMFVFGAIVMLVPCYLYYTTILPSQLPAIEAMLEASYKASPQSRAMWTEIYQGEPISVISKLTSRANLWANMWSSFSTTVFLGAIVSLVNACILRRKAQTK